MLPAVSGLGIVSAVFTKLLRGTFRFHPAYNVCSVGNSELFLRFAALSPSPNLGALCSEGGEADHFVSVFVCPMSANESLAGQCKRARRWLALFCHHGAESQASLNRCWAVILDRAVCAISVLDILAPRATRFT